MEKGGKEKNPNRIIWAQLAGLFAVGTLVVWGTLASDRQLEKVMPETRIYPSVNNVRPSGLSAFYKLCEKVFSTAKHGRQVGEWDLPYRRLKDGTVGALGSDDTAKNKNRSTHAILIIVNPDQSLARFEVDQILAWVRLGNSVIYLDDFQFRDSKRLLDDVHVTARELNPPLLNKVSDPRLATTVPVYTHLHTLNLSADQKLGGGTTLVSSGESPIIVEATVGKGRVLIGSCPAMVSNQQVSQTERWSNFQFLCNWIATTDGDIYFDEKCHGASNGTNVIFYFLRGPAGWTILQLALLLTIAIVSSSQRFGAITLVRNQRRISNLEHINGLSNTYYRAGAREAILAIIWTGVRQKLCKVLQINPHEGDEKLNEALSAQQRLDGTKNSPALENSAAREDADDVAVLVRQCQAAVNRKDLNDKELRELVAACDKITEQSDRLLTTSTRQ